MVRALAVRGLCTRPAQEDSLRAIASGRDVVVNSGTASGKVLIYQLPADDLPAARRRRLGRAAQRGFLVSGSGGSATAGPRQHLNLTRL